MSSKPAAGHYPLLLHIIARPGSDAADRDEIASILESYILRRMVCGMNTRGYGAAFIKWISRIADLGPNGAASPRLRAILSEDLGSSLRWPSDSQFKEALVSRPLYGNIRRERLLLILQAMEEARRAASTKTAILPLDHLQIEHIMPQAWQKFWPLLSADPESTEHRVRAVDTLGNLTLVTSQLNVAMSNAPWVHNNPKMSKRAALDEHDVLFLNREIANRNHEKRPTWDEAQITSRAIALAERAILIWPSPTL